ncbi:cupin domain-containing protein [Chimaeribacter arupi]|uniref:cupin domain-containing protein n=1 Tax=Chimaeribacter arupi TaxID=2060066 RepID=UPI002947F293|nr:cupin domain-containing protein [Chimaeribacter arupi]MDV5141262.1 cupin domain-containing protein [Chimaeribacter arupi]
MERISLTTPAHGVPNSPYPVMLYHHVIPPDTADNAAYLEHLFTANGWPPQWRYPVYPFTHFHTTTHEVVGCYAGTARLQLGGEQGPVHEVKPGDVLLIPAGVGHKQLSADKEFMLVGAYPVGFSPDLCRDEPALLSARTKAVQDVPLPKSDPVTGHNEGVLKYWAAP